MLIALYYCKIRQDIEDIERAYPGQMLPLLACDVENGSEDLGVVDEGCGLAGVVLQGKGGAALGTEGRVARGVPASHVVASVENK